MNSLYDGGREAFLAGDVDWLADDIIVVATDSGYTPDFALDSFLDDIPGAAIIATSGALTGKTATAGVADADDVVFESVPAGDTINRIIFVKDTGVAASSRLIGAIDTLAGGGSIAVPTSGGDLLFRFDAGANKIFKL